MTCVRDLLTDLDVGEINGRPLFDVLVKRLEKPGMRQKHH